MTIASEVYIMLYTGDGASTDYPFTFRIWEDSQLQVIKYKVSDGTQTLLNLTTDYTVTIEEDGSGTVHLNSAISSVYQLWIRRDLPYKQLLDLIANDPMPAENLETAHDKAVCLILQIKERGDRAIVINSSDKDSGVDPDLPPLERLKVIGVNSDATGLVMVDNSLYAVEGAEAARDDAETAQAAAEAAEAAAAISAAAAAVSAASINLPSSLSGQANKFLQVKGDESGYDHVALLDEDDMASDDDNTPATQQSIKAYSDIHNKGQKGVPVDADEFVLADSQDAWAKKRITRSELITAILDQTWPAFDAVVHASGEIKSSDYVADSYGWLLDGSAGVNINEGSVKASIITGFDSQAFKMAVLAHLIFEEN